MEHDKNGRRILNHLALIYIALAHSTDDVLTNSEIDAIAERLRGWQDVASETVLSALKEALDIYVQDDAQERLQEAVDAVSLSIPTELRQAVLDDLMDIALADDKFLHKEGSFIGDLARAWDLHASVSSAEADQSWSILGGQKQEGNWTALHDLAIIYLTLAHQTDGDLSVAEAEAITAKLNEWVPDASEEEVRGVLKDAVTVYAQGPDQRVFTEAVEAVESFVPEHQRTALLEDLKFVAGADGNTIEAEHELITRLTRKWNLSSAS